MLTGDCGVTTLTNLTSGATVGFAAAAWFMSVPLVKSERFLAKRTFAAVKLMLELLNSYLFIAATARLVAVVIPVASKFKPEAPASAAASAAF